MIELETLIKILTSPQETQKDLQQYHESEIVQSATVYLHAYQQAKRMLMSLAGVDPVTEIERKAKAWTPLLPGQTELTPGPRGESPE